MNAVSVIPPQQMGVSEIQVVASAIAKGGLFGSKDPNAVLTLCLLAYAEGQHPAVVFRDYHIIQGKPAKKADAMLRDFINSGGKVKWHDLSDDCADATFSHPAGEARIEWTIERAKQAGITNPMWRKYPRQMLRSRVISEGVRTVYPGATSGLYEENEVRDMAEEVGSDDRAYGGEEQPAPMIEAQARHNPRTDPWSDFYSGKSALHKGLNVHAAELRRIGEEGNFDDLEAYQTSPEYADFIRVAGEHMPHYLEGGEPAPPEFVGIFALEQRARDLIGLRGNQAVELENA